ncbi:MAG: Crp/Fnr family transcriptional regulator [Bacteroidota bacterium]
MEQLKQAIGQMINTTPAEMGEFLRRCEPQTHKKRANLSSAGTVPNEVLFIEQGIIRVCLTDSSGVEHTIHFALENQFICDYSAFLRQEKSLYDLETLEETRLVVIPRSAIEWGYEHLAEGDRMGRSIAEFYFIYQDNRIKNQYIRTPKERYDNITDVFPNIHNRAPQHMIASYLGITSVHLSRLKKESYRKT